MFLGIRDIFFAKGRFVLIASVVGLLTLLLVMLTGLTGGLGKQNTAALESFKADRFVFAASGSGEPEVSFTSSAVTAEDQAAWAGADSVASATPVGFAQTKVDGVSSASAALIGIPADSSLMADSVGPALEGSENLAENTLVIGETVAEEAGVAPGDKVSVSGIDFTVGGVVEDTYYSHQPVIWANTAGWQQVAHQPSTVLGTVLAVAAPAASDDVLQALADETHTIATSTGDSFAGLPAYKSEQGSLKAMQGFLYGISALVTISFLTVWTIQRTRDLAVMRALGGSTGYLLRDALVQAAIVLLIGAAGGLLIGWGLGALAAGTVPFTLSLATVAGPALGIWLLGILGSFIATARVTKIDPMIALGGN